MTNSESQIILSNIDIINLIYTIRGSQVMIDTDLAELYNVETRVLNQAVSRNIKRFPEAFRFQLTFEEFESLRSQFVILKEASNLISQSVISSSGHGGRRKLPYAFTEQGVVMLSAVLKSETAIQVSIQIVDAFVNMRKFLIANAQIFQRIDSLEKKQLEHKIKSDEKFERIFEAIEEKGITPDKGIFFDGQIFDAHRFVSDIIRSAKKSIAIVDNFIDDSVLTLLTKRKKNVTVTIYTKTISKIFPHAKNIQWNVY